MKCPVCTGLDLILAERQGVEIDYCPECRGVWLDRGELDKLVERSYASASGQPPAGPQNYQGGPDRQHYKEGHRDGRDTRQHGHGHQQNGHSYQQNGQQTRKSWLSELFD